MPKLFHGFRLFRPCPQQQRKRAAKPCGKQMVAPIASSAILETKMSMIRTLRWYIKAEFGAMAPTHLPGMLRHRRTVEYPVRAKATIGRSDP